MKKPIRTLILTLSILATTGISSAVYAQECNSDNTLNTVKAEYNLQSIGAKYGITFPKGIVVRPQVTNNAKTAPTKAAPVKTTPVEATPAKAATPAKETPTKVETPDKAATPTKETPTKVETPVKAATPAKEVAQANLSEDNKLEKEVVTLVNQERAKQGLAALKDNVELSKVARAKSKDMIDKNYFSHTSPTYGSPFDMMKQFGITYTAAGENIAMGQPTAASVMEGWMNSPGHKANILSENFTEIGVGVAKDESGTIYWTQQFIGK